MSTENGSVLSGNPASAGTTAAAPASNAPATNAPWYGSNLDADTAAWVQSKNLPDAAAALTSYRNLEKFMGAEKAGRGVVIPRDDADAKEWGAFWGKLGRPETADGYKLPVPEGDKGDFAKAAANWFHEMGVPAKMAEGIAGKWNEFAAQQKTQSEQAWAARVDKEMGELETAWGDKFEANAELAKRARRESGLSEEQGAAIERALGVKVAAEVFAKLGKQFAEAPMKGGEGQGRGSFNGTPDAAKQRINALMSDKAWVSRMQSGDVNAQREWNELHELAFGTQG